MSGKSAPLVPPKTFTEDSGSNQAQAELAVIEESKDEQLANTNANIAVAPQQEPSTTEQQVKKGFFASIAGFFSKGEQ